MISKTNLLALACTLAAFAALLASLHAGHPVQAHLVHSDALYLPVLFDDLLARDGALANWYLTPAPYFFPDFPLYLLAWLGGSGVFAQTTIYALLQTVSMAGAVFLVARQALDSYRLLAAAVLVIVFIWLGMHADDPFVRLYSSAHHYGAFIAALLLAALWLRLDAGRDDRDSRIAAAAVVALAYLATLSDALFLVQAVAPLLATVWLYRRHAVPGAGLGVRRAAILFFLPAIVAMLSYRFVVAHPTRYKARLGLAKFSANLEELGTICTTLFGPRPLLAVVLLLSLLAGFSCILAVLRGKAPASLPRPLQLLLVFATLSCAAAVSVMLLSTTVQPVPRYLIAALSWPLVAGTLALAFLLGARVRLAGLGLAFVFSGLLANDAWRTRNQHDSDSFFYPEQIACIDRALASSGARHGIAQYWDAKRVQALSRRHPTLAQYTGKLDQMEWITSQRYFSTRYDFAILADQEAAEFRLPQAQLFAINGEPKQTVTCGDRTLLLFGPGGLRLAPPVQSAR